MRHLYHLSVTLFAATVVLYGCSTTPATKSDTAPAVPSKETKPEAPPAARPAPSRDATPQAPAPRVDQDLSIDGGMTIFEMQERLSALGYKPGSVDGVPGAKTVDALKSFQSDNKLPATGNLDPDTIRKLRTAKLPAVPAATKN